jgi:hypothetical protein
VRHNAFLLFSGSNPLRLSPTNPQSQLPPSTACSVATMPAAKTKVKKTLLKKKASDQKPPRMTPDEKRLVRDMFFEQKMKKTKIAETVGRDLSNICRLLAQTKVPNKIGRPESLTETQKDTVVKLLDKMVDEAEAGHEVTLDMLLRRSRLQVSPRTLADAIHERGYWFRDLRHKPILTPDDVKKRYAFSKKHKDKSDGWWLKKVLIHIDNHVFKVATTPAGRKLLAKRRTRGVYRKKGKSLRPGHVKPSPKLKQYTGAKGILKAGGVGGGKVLVWHTVEGRWGGDAAHHLYTKVVTPALKRRYPGKKSFCLLEDNDPTGNRSGKGLAAKAACKLTTFEIPKRSPDLNVLDYAVWSEVEKRMRKQEQNFPEHKRETRSEFEARLDATAKRLPASFINKSIANMKERCQKLYDAKGGLFEEGGRPRRRRPL